MVKEIYVKVKIGTYTYISVRACALLLFSIAADFHKEDIFVCSRVKSHEAE